MQCFHSLEYLILHSVREIQKKSVDNYLTFVLIINKLCKNKTLRKISNGTVVVQSVHGDIIFTWDLPIFYRGSRQQSSSNASRNLTNLERGYCLQRYLGSARVKSDWKSLCACVVDLNSFVHPHQVIQFAPVDVRVGSTKLQQVWMKIFPVFNNLELNF